MALKTTGQVDILTTAIVIFVIAFLGLLTFLITDGFSDALAGVDNSSTSGLSKQQLTTYNNNPYSGLDQGLVIALGLVFVLTLVFAGRINTNPGFFFIFFFLLVIILATVSFLPQLFDGTNTVQFGDARAALPMSTFVASNLFQISGAMGVLVLLVLFSKINKGV